jgi:hypothetical protein
MTLEIDRGDLPNRVKTSFMSVGNSADSPEPIHRPLPATGHDAEMLDVYDPDLGYYKSGEKRRCAYVLGLEDELGRRGER